MQNHIAKKQIMAFNVCF